MTTQSNAKKGSVADEPEQGETQAAEEPAKKKAKVETGDAVKASEGNEDGSPAQATSSGAIAGESSAANMSHEELKSLGVRQYLEKTVVPILLQGMQEVGRTRPQDPLEALAEYLRKNKPGTASLKS